MSTGAPIPPYPPPPPRGSGNTVLKIVLIVAGVFVLFGVVAVGVIGFGAYKFSKAVHKDSNGNVALSTPGGTLTTGSSARISVADLGTVPYPGASNVDAGSMNMRTPTGSIVTCVYTSPDPSTKIVDFYKEKLGGETSVVQRGKGTVLSVGDKSRDTVMVTVTPQDDLSKIVIMHVTSTNSQ
jgi:hypothetical protein